MFSIHDFQRLVHSRLDAMGVPACEVEYQVWEQCFNENSIGEQSNGPEALVAIHKDRADARHDAANRNIGVSGNHYRSWYVECPVENRIAARLDWVAEQLNRLALLEAPDPDGPWLLNFEAAAAICSRPEGEKP